MNKLSEKMAAIHKMIKEKSPFDTQETRRILKKFFSRVPNSVKILIEKYDFDKKKVLDIGCMYGQTLLYWGEGEGIDVYEPAGEFLKSLGVKINIFNVEEGFNGLNAERYEAIYCSNLIEHLIAPHLFLMRLNVLLMPQSGILAIGIPVVSGVFSCLWKLFDIKGWLAKEHINFFTTRTARLILERAGFEIIDQRSPGLYKFSPFLSKIVVGLVPHCIFICRKKKDFNYGEARRSGFNPVWAKDLDKFN